MNKIVQLVISMGLMFLVSGEIMTRQWYLYRATGGLKTLSSFTSNKVDAFGYFYSDNQTDIQGASITKLNITIQENGITTLKSRKWSNIKINSPFKYPAQLRITLTQNDMAEQIFITFNKEQLLLYEKPGYQYKVVKTVSGESLIVDSIFKTNSKSTFFLLSKAEQNFTLECFNKTVLLKTITLPISVNEKFVQMVSSAQRLFLCFTKGVFILTETEEMNLLTFIEIPQTVEINHSFDAFNNFLGYSFGKTVTLMDISNILSPKVIRTVTVNIQVTNFRIRESYIYILTNKGLFSYDIDINLTIFYSERQTSKMNIQVIHNGILFLHSIGPFFRSVGRFQLLNRYKNTTVDCYESYFYMDGFCTKNESYIFQLPQIEQTQIIDSEIQAHYESSTESESAGYHENQNSIDQKKMKKQNENMISEIVGKALSFSSSKILPFVFHFSGLLLDDIWYYKFHRVEYPASLLFFTENIDIINYFRLNPWFLDKLDLLDNIEISGNQRQKYLQYLSENSHNPESTYFLNSSKEIYVDNWILVVTVFAVFKAISLLLFLLKQKFRKLRGAYRYLANNSRWWTLLCSLLESNVMRASFNCALQFLFFFSFDLRSKLNLLLAMVIFLVLLTFSTVFYVMVFAFEKQKSAEILLAHSQYTAFSFIFEPLCFLFRSCVRGFLQGILVESYEHQIIALTVTDALFVCLVFCFRKCFFSRALFVVILLYNIAFFCLDAILTLIFTKPHLFVKIDENKLIFFMICSIIATYVLQIIIPIALTVYKTFCNEKKSDQNLIEKSTKEESQKKTQKTLLNLNNFKINSDVFRTKTQLKTQVSHNNYVKKKTKKVKIESLKNQIVFIPVESSKNKHKKKSFSQKQTFSKEKSIQ